MEFPETHWSLLARASLNGEPAAQEALDRFCQSYRPAVVGFVRWCGHQPQDAEELAQEFFLRLLASRAWRRADRSQGRFRSFLLGALKHHLADARRRATAEKRGGGVAATSLEDLIGTDAEPRDLKLPEGAEHEFDRDWAIQVVENALDQLTREVERGGRREHFNRLVPFLPIGAEPPSYENLADDLGMTIGGAKAEVHRLRQRFRTALRAEIARTVSAPHEIDVEMAYLHSVLGHPGFDSGKKLETPGLQ